MSRDADNRVIPNDGAHGRDGQVGLTDMDAVGVRQPRDVGAIVDDDPRPGGVRHAGNLLGQRRQLRARLVLPATKLQQPRATPHAGLGHCDRVKPPLPAERSVDDGVDDGEHQVQEVHGVQEVQTVRWFSMNP